MFTISRWTYLLSASVCASGWSDDVIVTVSSQSLSLVVLIDVLVMSTWHSPLFLTSQSLLLCVDGCSDDVIVNSPVSHFSGRRHHQRWRNCWSSTRHQLPHPAPLMGAWTISVLPRPHPTPRAISPLSRTRLSRSSVRCCRMEMRRRQMAQNLARTSCPQTCRLTLLQPSWASNRSPIHRCFVLCFYLLLYII